MLSTSRAALVLVVVLSLIIGAVMPALAVTPTPLPFDNTLSVYAGHNGLWDNYVSGLQEYAEISDTVAVWQPPNPVSDDVVSWPAHEIAHRVAPEGWTFYGAAATGPMQIHVVVADTQSRLGRAIVTKRETGEWVATIPADANGSQIDGMASVDPTCQTFNIEVQSGVAGDVLFRAGADNAVIDDVTVIQVPYGWNPNRGDNHAPCPANPATPWGNPATWDATKVSVEMRMPASACLGPTTFENDTPNAGVATQNYTLQDKMVVRDTCGSGPATGLTATARDKVATALAAARQPYQNGTLVGSPLSLLPFSTGKAHWPAAVTGEITSLIYFPYVGIQKNKTAFDAKLTAAIPLWRSHGLNTATPAPALSAGITWGPGETKTYQYAAPASIGDVFGLRVAANGAAVAMPNSGIQQAVTFELWANLLPPAPGAPGLTGGTGTAVLDVPTTTPPPPGVMYQELALSFPGDGAQKGLCTVQLAKGWKWKATGRPAMMMAPYDTGSMGPFAVPRDPNAGNARIESHLTGLITLRVKTVSTQNGQTVATQSTVELQRQGQGGVWNSAGSGDTALQPNGDQVWLAPGPQSVGRYRVRAQARMGMVRPWSAWEEFDVNIGIEDTRTVTVTWQGMPGWGGPP